MSTPPPQLVQRSSEQNRQALRWLRGQTACARGWTWLAVAAGLLQALATVAQAGLLAWLLHGAIIEGQGWATLAPLFGGLPLAIALRAVAGYAREEAGLRASVRVRAELRRTLLARLAVLGPAWAGQQQGGALVSQLLDQVEALEGFVARYQPQQWLAVLVPVLILCVVFPVSWGAGLILLATAPLIPLFMAIVGHAARARQQQQLQALARMSGQFLETLRGLPTLRSLDAHRRQAEVVEHTAEGFRVRTMRVLRLAFLSGTVLEFFASIAIALSAVYLGFSLLGVLDFGFWGAEPSLLVAFFVLLLAPDFYLPLRELGTHYHARAEALAAADLLRPVLDANPPQLAGGTHTLGPQAPHIVFDRVVFAHQTGVPVLQQASFTLKAGETVAIVGESGAGKTTLLRLLLGQLTAQGGRITVEGEALSALALADWRERIGWMSQHPRLLAASLADNLRVACVEADEAALCEALRFAGLGAWFEALPDGLATPLGEGGRRLSGGQLRRLALARLRLRRASVLLLDEPTASLDSQTEQWVVARLAELCQGRSVILLTHRSAPLRLADRVLALREGQLVTQAPGEPVMPAVRPPAASAAASAPEPTHAAFSRAPHAGPERAAAALRPAATAATAVKAPGLRATLAPFVRLLMRERFWMVAGLLLTLLTLVAGLGLLGLSGGFLAATAIAGLTPATAISFNFFHPAAGVRFFAIARTASRWGERVVTHEATFRLLARLRVWLYRAIAPLSPRQLGRHHGADLLGSLTRDVDALDNLYQRLALPVLAAGGVLLVLALMFAFGIGASVWPLWGLAGMGLLGLPALSWWLGRERAPALLVQRDALRRALLDSVEGLDDLALHAPAWQAQQRRTLAAGSHWLAGQLALQRRGALVRALLVMVVGLATWATLGLMLPGAHAHQAAALSGPWLAAVVLLMLGTAEALQGLPAAWMELPGTLAAARRLNALASEQPDPAFVEQGAVPAHGGVEVRGLCFAFDPAVPVLDGLDVDIRSGEHVALVGPSGGGKSTLASLLARLESPVAGRILLGGVPLEAIDEPTLRAHLVCVGQDAWVFSGTVADNLRLACPQASEAELQEVLAAVGLADTVARWSEGVNSWLDEGGASLSGGERRRLALARALLRDARVLVLDEPSEGLDAQASARLVDSLRRRLHGRTLIWISHKPEALEGFERVLRLEQGRLLQAASR